MVDLTKEQVLAEPVKCWVKDKAESVWSPRWLVAIAEGLYHTLDGCDHSINATLIDAFRIGTYIWENCSLTDPTVPTKKIKKWETIEDVPPELWGRALVRYKNDRPQFAVLMSPYDVVDCDGKFIGEKLHYLPLGQSLTGEWLPFESEVVDG